MSDTVFILSLVVASSCLAVIVGCRWGLQARWLPWALVRAFRCVGASLIFWAVNVALGAIAALLVRGLHRGFVSLYISTDVSVLVLSAIQALVFESWRARVSGTPSRTA